jgi:hypothetical protein
MKTPLRRHVPLLLIMLALLLVYLDTLQTIPNGSEHYFMIDVGETQIVLNTWGTLHATGYPLYVMLGNGLVSVLRVVGISPVVAPAMTSLLYGLAALALLYRLLERITGQRWLVAAGLLCFGLTRTVWIHHVIAEIYTFGLLILVGLLVLALWPGEVRWRLYGLALMGGIGVFHHRAIAMLIPALVYAVWADIWRTAIGQARLPVMGKRLAICLLLGLIGFLPYAYLPARAAVNAAWVYGEPGSWQGFWDQFWGREAARFIGTPSTWEGLIGNIQLVNTVLLTDLTLLGIIAGVIGLLLGVHNPARRKFAITLLLSGLVAYLFHILVYTDVLSALILAVTLSLAGGWVLLLEVTWGWLGTHWMGLNPPQIKTSLIAIVVLVSVLGLWEWNHGFIRGLTSDPTGLDTIVLAEGTPTDATLMLDWGPRHFAVGLARDVLGQRIDIQLVDHKVDFRTINSQLVTPAFTFYNRPVNWWQEQLGQPVYLRAVAPWLVEIGREPVLSDSFSEAIRVQAVSVDCSSPALDVEWVNGAQTTGDLSVFVHLLDARDVMLGQADQSAPVYGWRPVSSWETGEVVRDVYPLPTLQDVTRIRFGLYRQRSDGSFENVLEQSVAVACNG